MATAEEKIAEIEKRQRELTEKGEQAERDGNHIMAGVYRAGARMMESDKMFRVGDEVLKVYRKVIQDGTVEVNGMKWPLDTIITPATNTDKADKQ